MVVISGVVKFCDSVKKYPTSKLRNAFHTFGKSYCPSIKSNSSNTRKAAKARRGKIFVQPEAVKKRKTDSGSSRNSLIKGMTKKTILLPHERPVLKDHIYSLKLYKKTLPYLKRPAGR